MADDAEMLTMAAQLVVSALVSDAVGDKRDRKLAKIAAKAERLRERASAPEPKVVSIADARGGAPKAAAEANRLNKALADIVLEAVKAELSAQRSLEVLFNGGGE